MRVREGAGQPLTPTALLPAVLPAACCLRSILSLCSARSSALLSDSGVELRLEYTNGAGTATDGDGGESVDERAEEKVKEEWRFGRFRLVPSCCCPLVSLSLSLPVATLAAEARRSALLRFLLTRAAAWS